MKGQRFSLGRATNVFQCCVFFLSFKRKLLHFYCFIFLCQKKKKTKKSLGVRAHFRLVGTDIVHFGPDSK